MGFDRTALQSGLEQYSALVGPTIVTMQQFMWQSDPVGVAHYVLSCLEKLHSPIGGQSDLPYPNMSLTPFMCFGESHRRCLLMLYARGPA